METYNEHLQVINILCKIEYSAQNYYNELVPIANSTQDAQLRTDLSLILKNIREIEHLPSPLLIIYDGGINANDNLPLEFKKYLQYWEQFCRKKGYIN